MTALCRDCGATGRPADDRCRRCRSPRLVNHPELAELAIAHIDCDAFYAAVEKRDNPALVDRPVIIGGIGNRGVVSTACYIARMYGVRSAMPMYQALKACPGAVVLRPNMARYAAVGQQVRGMMREMAAEVEPVSIDEAYLDLANQRFPAAALAGLARRIETEIGITVSIGLGPNKFLAKIASDLDKPRGFAVIGRAEAESYLAPKPVGLLWGVGEKLARRLAGDGIGTIGQLRDLDETVLVARYGSIGHRLAQFARGLDDRKVRPRGEPKSLSAETTFAADIADPETLERCLRPLSETVARRLRTAGLAAAGVVLKLKTGDFRILTRSRALSHPTQRAETIQRAAAALLAAEPAGVAYRLIGVGTTRLAAAELADPPDMLAPLEPSP